MNDTRAASGNGVQFYLGGDLVDQAETAYGGSAEAIGIAAAYGGSRRNRGADGAGPASTAIPPAAPGIASGPPYCGRG